MELIAKYDINWRNFASLNIIDRSIKSAFSVVYNRRAEKRARARQKLFVRVLNSTEHRSASHSPQISGLVWVNQELIRNTKLAFARCTNLTRLSSQHVLALVTFYFAVFSIKFITHLLPFYPINWFMCITLDVRTDSRRQIAFSFTSSEADEIRRIRTRFSIILSARTMPNKWLNTRVSAVLIPTFQLISVIRWSSRDEIQSTFFLRWLNSSFLKPDGAQLTFKVSLMKSDEPRRWNSMTLRFEWNTKPRTCLSTQNLRYLRIT